MPATTAKPWISPSELQFNDLPDKRIEIPASTARTLRAAGISPSFVRSKVRSLYNENRGRKRPWARGVKVAKKTPKNSGPPPWYTRTCDLPEAVGETKKVDLYHVEIRVEFFAQLGLAHASVVQYYHYKPQAI